MEKKLNEIKVDTHSPFTARQDFEGVKEFDKYYIDRSVKDVFVKTGVDSDGEEVGIIREKIIDKKIDINEYLKSQVDSVGVENYMKTLALQGVDINELNTVVSDEVNDFTKCPETLADTLGLGDAAREAFNNLDPALKGNHTTLEGFLGSLSQETLEAYLKNKVGIKPTESEGEK